MRRYRMDPDPSAKRLSCMRVGLHVGQLFQPVPGGIGRVTELLCEELPRHAEVVAFASTSRHSRRQFRARVGETVDFRSIGSTSPRWKYEVWNRFRGGRIDLGVDVCHAPSLAVPPTTAPLVVTVNDVAFLRHPETSTPHGIRFHERGLDIARREARAVIVPSEFTRTELLREGFDARWLHCVPLAVRVPECLHRPTLLAGLRSRGVRRPYLLAVGTIEPRKDHATLLAAFARVRIRHPDLALVVAGAPGWLPADARRALGHPGVVAVGAVPDADLDSLYDHAAIVVNASIYEGFGLSVLEGLAHGRSVVATGIPSHIEIAGDAARLFEPGDVDALTAHIEAVLAEPDRGFDVARVGRERARQFDVASTIAAHVAVYELAAGGG